MRIGLKLHHKPSRCMVIAVNKFPRIIIAIKTVDTPVEYADTVAESLRNRVIYRGADINTIGA